MAVFNCQAARFYETMATRGLMAAQREKDAQSSRVSVCSRMAAEKQFQSQASPLALMGSLFLGAFLGFEIVVALKYN